VDFTEIPIGVMQGRLLPKYKGRYQAHPVGNWKSEFPIAQSLGLSRIELILDFEGAEENPLLKIGGDAEINAACESTFVEVRSVCADYFVASPMHAGTVVERSRSVDVLSRLISTANAIGVTDIVIPCVDRSSLGGAEAMQNFAAAIKPNIKLAEDARVNLCLETDLDPQNFINLLELIDSRAVTVNYDIGNSASLGYDPIDEFLAYGSVISDIHVKDRILKGSSVVLGSGSANFERFFAALHKVDYPGAFILQVFRDDEGLSIFKSQLEWFRNLLQVVSRKTNGK